MGLKRKQIVQKQKASFERELKDRLAALAAKGAKQPETDRDTLVRRLKAEIKASKRRLARIAELDKRTEELALAKAEKAAAPKKEKAEAGAKPPKPKAGPQEAKAKKPKTPAEGGKASKKAEAPAEKSEAPAKPEK